MSRAELLLYQEELTVLHTCVLIKSLTKREVKNFSGLEPVNQSLYLAIVEKSLQGWCVDQEELGVRDGYCSQRGPVHCCPRELYKKALEKVLPPRGAATRPG